MTDKSHSILSPSGADRWLSCVGSLAACKDAPVQRTNEPAAKGTAKHSVGERVLSGEQYIPFGEIVKVDGFDFEIDEEFAAHVKVYVDYVRSRPGKKMLEVWLSTSAIFEVPHGQGGTADCVHLDAAAREIEIIDAKFGYIPVSAEHRQLRIYGAAALHLYSLEGEWETVRCTIVQPQDSPAVKSVVYTRDQIFTFIGSIQAAAQQAYRLYQEPPRDLLDYLTPSEAACQWCPISGACAARSNQIIDMFAEATVNPADAVLLSDERIAELYTQTADIVEWAQSIAAEAESRALRGQDIPGYKLAYGRKGPRAYTDGVEDRVSSILSLALGAEAIYAPRKLKSPTQVEAALKAANAPALYEQIAPYVTQADAKLRLVPVSAKGEAVMVQKVEFQHVE